MSHVTWRPEEARVASLGGGREETDLEFRKRGMWWYMPAIPAVGRG
jgi:hypothetical protein